MSFTPRFTLDLQSASVGAFLKTLEEFEEWRREQDQRDLDLTNGWKTITPEIAEGMLLRNPVGSNRRPTLQTVKYYANQMLHGQWKKTGQAILFTDQGVLLDASHRLWAAYLSGATFPSYVIGDVPHEDTLFAFIDGGKARTHADALATAGLNGLAKHLSAVIQIAMLFESGCYTSSAKKKMDKVPAIDFIHYLQQHENLRTAARLMAGEHKAAASVIHYRDMASFAAFQILELHGEEALDEFMGELGHVRDDLDDGSPTVAFQKVMEDDAKSKNPLEKHQVLGILIKAFNAWMLKEPTRKLQLRVNEAYPDFIRPQPSRQAAE